MRSSWLLVCLFTAGAFLFGCAPIRAVQQLRLRNSGTAPITNLRVLFPEQEIAFGDVPPGATTVYKAVPKGVYRYAAYRYDVNGETVTQPVIDWVGESPIEGSSFTYTITYDPAAQPFQRIQLLDVNRDS